MPIVPTFLSLHVHRRPATCMPYECRTALWRGSGGMARTRQDKRMDTKTARMENFKGERREPWWRPISKGLAIGYRRGTKGGTWIARHYSPQHGRRYQSIGTADDMVDAD